MSGAALGFTHVFEPAARPGLPTLLLLHGTGGNEHDLLGLGRTLLPGAALLAPRGGVLENGMPRFFRRIATGIFDEADLRRRAVELADFVTAAAGAYGLDVGRVIAVGYSNGANIASAAMLLRPRVLRGAALLRPMMPLHEAAAPNLGGRRVLLASGRRDPTVPPDHPERLAALLRAAGADVTLHWSAAGHELVRQDVDAAADWLAASPDRAASAAGAEPDTGRVGSAG